jgi:hypothetical protein
MKNKKAIIVKKENFKKKMTVVQNKIKLKINKVMTLLMKIKKMIVI